MQIQTILVVIFLVLLGLVLYINRKKIFIQKILFPLLYFIMIRTKVGLNLMDRIAKRFSRPLKYVGYFAIFIGFAGMLLIAFELVRTLYGMVTRPEAIPGVGLVLPFEVKGAFYVPFFYWIISIFVLAVVHEFSHGIMARKYGMKIKSSGFAFVGVIVPILPAAFVEPDEKKLQKKPRAQQMSVFAAGPFANIVFGFIILGIMALTMAPAINSLVDFNGVKITEVMANKSVDAAGIKEGEVIKEIEGLKVDYTTNISAALENKKPGETISVKTDKGDYKVKLVENPKNESMPYLGVYIEQSREIKPGVRERYGEFLPEVALWFFGLLYFLYLLNLGVGLFNLVPIGPIDGGRMLRLALQRFFDEKKADGIWKNISAIFLSLVIVIVVLSFLR